MSSKTNLLIITFDQCRGDFINHELDKLGLSTIEEICKESYVFWKCYTSSPHCIPARLSWITGLKPGELGVTRNMPVNLREEAPSCIRSFQERGWNTCLIGKTHWTNHNKGGDLRKNRELLYKLGFNQTIEVAGPKAMRRMECELSDQWKKEGVYDEQMRDLDFRYRSGIKGNSWQRRPSVLPNHLYPDIWIADRACETIKKMTNEEPWLIR